MPMRQGGSALKNASTWLRRSRFLTMTFSAASITLWHTSMPEAGAVHQIKSGKAQIEQMLSGLSPTPDIQRRGQHVGSGPAPVVANERPVPTSSALLHSRKLEIKSAAPVGFE